MIPFLRSFLLFFPLSFYFYLFFSFALLFFLSETKLISHGRMVFNQSHVRWVCARRVPLDSKDSVQLIKFRMLRYSSRAAATAAAAVSIARSLARYDERPRDCEAWTNVLRLGLLLCVLPPFLSLALSLTTSLCEYRGSQRVCVCMACQRANAMRTQNKSDEERTSNRKCKRKSKEREKKNHKNHKKLKLIRFFFLLVFRDVYVYKIEWMNNRCCLVYFGPHTCARTFSFGSLIFSLFGRCRHHRGRRRRRRRRWNSKMERCLNTHQYAYKQQKAHTNQTNQVNEIKGQ